MLKYLVTRGLAPTRRARCDPSSQRPARGRTSLNSFRPLIEGLEDRTLLSFIAALSYAVGYNPRSVAVGDFNGDGYPDLAAANSGRRPDFTGTVNVLLGNGDGTFQPAQSYTAGRYAVSVAVGDFDGDGHLDLAVANSYSGTVSVLL